MLAIGGGWVYMEANVCVFGVVRCVELLLQRNGANHSLVDIVNGVIV